jgi:hypothetical protein
MTGRRTLIKALAVVAGVGSVAGVAVAATTGGPPAPAPAEPQQRSAQPIAAPDVQQQATLGILRRAVTRSDDAPQTVRDMVTKGSGPELGANAALARRAITTGLGEQLYVVPGQGWVCLMSSAGRSGCTPTTQITEGYAVQLQPIPSGYRLAGLVPDGASRVDIRGDADSATTAPSGNAWTVDVAFEPKSVAWTGPAGEKVVPVYAPPKEPTAPVAPAGLLDTVAGAPAAG